MIIYETKKRRVVRACGVVHTPGYSNLENGESLTVRLYSTANHSQYCIEISFGELASLVRMADQFAADPGINTGSDNSATDLREWRNWGNK